MGNNHPTSALIMINLTPKLFISNIRNSPRELLHVKSFSGKKAMIKSKAFIYNMKKWREKYGEREKKQNIYETFKTDNTWLAQ